MLSLSPRVRYAIAWDHALCRAVVGVAVRSILGCLRRRSRQQGVAGGRGGAVVIVQRFGSALNLNVHVHALVLDGVYAPDPPGTLTFHATGTPTEVELEAVLATIERRVARLLTRRGVPDEGATADPWADEAPVLAGLAAASVQGRVALGPRAGAALRRIGNPEMYRLPILDPAHARGAGFDLHAGLVVPARDRAWLERICRSALRPPLAEDRLRLTDAGQVRLQLRRRWSDGTSHVLFDPVELLERLAAITPRPRVNLILYYGVLGARAAWRTQVVPRGGTTADEGADRGRASADGVAVSGARQLWADLMRRSFGFDVLACPQCGGRLR